MKSSTTPEIIAGGIDQRYNGEENKASAGSNFRYDPDGGWVNDRGWEPLLTPLPVTISLAQLEDLFQPCRFLQIIQRHQGNEEYYVQERNGKLFYQYGNDYTGATPPQCILGTDRNNPKPDDPGTQGVPYGRFTLFLNGYNKMIKWWGRKKTEQFGFYQQPPSPTLLPVDTTYQVASTFPYEAVVTIPSGSNTDNTLYGTALQFWPNLLSNFEYTDMSLGLGVWGAGSENSYSYKYSYVSNTGSESPLSSPTTISWTSEGSTARKYGVYVTGLEPGPAGTVARRVYRTKNKRSGFTYANAPSDNDTYYFVAQIDENLSSTYVDVASDNQLIIEAPAVTDSVTLSTTFKYGAAFNGSMWLAGGEAYPTKLIYSVSGLPEQFRAFDYFDVGVRDGGQITALYPYYDVLLVFRERAIDAVFVNAQSNGYSCTTINKDVGTPATNTIRLIPGKGVMFLNKDGFWLISGGMRGGSSLNVSNMSPMIETEIGRVSKNALPRATAAYSDREKEYWCHYPVNGQTENTTGAVYNIVNDSWMFRGVNTQNIDDGFLKQWAFTQIATDQSGYFILGTKPKNYDTVSPGSSDSYPGLGLQVWTAVNAWGFYTGISGGESIYLTFTPVTPDACFWQSSWYDFGDDSVKKRVVSVEAEIITGGNAPIYCFWGQDWNYKLIPMDAIPIQLPVGVPQQQGEFVGTKSEQATYQYNQVPFFQPFKQGNPAEWDATKWENQRVTRVRWDVNTGLISWFTFYLLGFQRFQILSFQINYIDGTVKTINPVMPGSR